MGTIIITVRNTFFKTEIIKYILPFNPQKAIFGWYSNFWKEQKLIHANEQKIDKNFIRASISFDNKPLKRMKIIFDNGAELDASFELNKIDRQIISLHLEALKLANSQ